MAGPILRIPVDDAAFKKFVETFAKYQRALEEQPEMWKGMNDGIGDAVAAGASFAAILGEQIKSTEDLEKGHDKLQSAKRKAAQAEDEEGRKRKKREEDEAKRRKEAIGQVKDYARASLDAAVNMAKWAAGGAVVGAVGTVLGGFGLADLAGSMGNQRRQAAGYGISIGQHQRAEVTLGRYLGVDSALENIANLNSDPEGRVPFHNAGVDPSGKDPAQLLNMMAMAIGKQYASFGPNAGALAHAHGYDRIFTADEMRQLAAVYKTGELAGTINGAVGYGGLKVNDKDARAWQKFMADVQATGYGLEDLAGNKLAGLAEPLGNVTKAFGRLIDNALTKQNLDWLADGISRFAKYIGTDDFKNGIKTFADDVVIVAKKMADALVFLGIIPDPNESQADKARDKYNQQQETDYQNGNLPYQHAAKWVSKESDAAIATASKAWGVSKNVLTGIFGVESAFGHNAGYSKAGALGPMQFIPSTAARYGVHDRRDLGQSMMGAAHLMHDLLKMFHGDTAEALAAYNAGEGSAKRGTGVRGALAKAAKHGGYWLDYMLPETQDYVRKQMGGGTRVIQHHIKITNNGPSTAQVVNAASAG